jgi:rRNA processing protein Krr1/Pno1
MPKSDHMFNVINAQGKGCHLLIHMLSVNLLTVIELKNITGEGKSKQKKIKNRIAGA